MLSQHNPEIMQKSPDPLSQEGGVSVYNFLGYLYQYRVTAHNYVYMCVIGLNQWLFLNGSSTWVLDSR